MERGENGENCRTLAFHQRVSSHRGERLRLSPVLRFVLRFMFSGLSVKWSCQTGSAILCDAVEYLTALPENETEGGERESH